MIHTPVLLDQVIEGLDIKKDGLYIDATAGEGGHFVKILEKGGKVLALDWDEKQIKNLKLKITNYRDIIFAVANFNQIAKVAERLNYYPVDGILFDLGLSMWQMSDGGRGFSYKNANEPLDMRINSRIQTKASDIVNVLDKAKLYSIFAKYSEEIYSDEIAESIVRRRISKRIQTVGDLVGAINAVLQHKGIHSQADKDKVCARIFQALRIIVNDELDNLNRALTQSLGILKTGGRLVVITFHSIEDRLVKRFMKSSGMQEINKFIGKGSKKKFERSAKLRVMIKV